VLLITVRSTRNCSGSETVTEAVAIQTLLSDKFLLKYGKFIETPASKINPL
jgi:hypothetical protein